MTYDSVDYAKMPSIEDAIDWQCMG